MNDARTGLVSRYDNGIRLVVKAKPGTSRARPPCLVPLAGGGCAVEIAVTAPPEDGKANKAILVFLASTLGLKKGAISVKTGTSGRLKLIEIESKNPAELEITIMTWAQKLSRK